MGNAYLDLLDRRRWWTPGQMGVEDVEIMIEAVEAVKEALEREVGTRRTRMLRGFVEKYDDPASRAWFAVSNGLDSLRRLRDAKANGDDLPAYRHGRRPPIAYVSDV